MNIKIDGNPGTGNTYQEVHINNVETYAPNATTVVNNHYGDRKPGQPPTDKASGEAERLQRRMEIMHYVGNLKPYVAPEWKNRYESLWQSVLDIPQVATLVYEPGKQKDTTFNRNLVANILCMMCNKGIISKNNATTLTFALENDKDHSVRAQLRLEPGDKEIEEAVRRLLN